MATTTQDWKGSWTLLDEQGGTALDFTSFISIEYRNQGQALSYPVEAGAFANYNKVQSPLDIKVTLSTQGSEADFEYVLDTLERYQKQAVKLSVSTPSALYGSMTLTGYSYRRSRGDGAGLLTVDLDLVEVREVATQVRTTVITQSKNPTSKDKTNTGRNQSVLFRIINWW